MYAMLGTRPDIAFAVTALSQFSNPGQLHWAAVKRVLRYLRGTAGYQLTYGAGHGGPSSDRTRSLDLHAYCDSDWGTNPDDRRSVTGYVFMLGRGAVSWQAQKQSAVALSSVEPSTWRPRRPSRRPCGGVPSCSSSDYQPTVPPPSAPTVQGSVALAKNPEHHERSKHVDFRHHFVREQVAAGTVAFEYVATELMLADVLTKLLSWDKHTRLLEGMGVHAASSAVGVLR
jgi:hypothetical protein